MTSQEPEWLEEPQLPPGQSSALSPGLLEGVTHGQLLAGCRLRLLPSPTIMAHVVKEQPRVCSWCPVMGLKQAEFLSQPGTPCLASCSGTTLEPPVVMASVARSADAAQLLQWFPTHPPATWKVPGPQLGLREG